MIKTFLGCNVLQQVAVNFTVVTVCNADLKPFTLERLATFHIIDLQLAELKISLDEGLMLATHATPVDLSAYAGARSALVVADEDQQFLAESYKDARHTMCAPSVREVGVFYDTEVAKSWIAESPVARASHI